MSNFFGRLEGKTTFTDIFPALTIFTPRLDNY